MLRSFLFNVYFYGYTAITVIFGLPLTLLPSRRPLLGLIHAWSKAVIFGMRHVGGIKLDLRALENLPKNGPYIIAGKHQSWVDGIIMMAINKQVAPVAMRDLEDFPLLGPIVRKLGLVLIDRCGGGVEYSTLDAGAKRARDEGRPILIYPEGKLVPVGAPTTYKKGVMHLYQSLDLPVVPVATNMGLRWPQNQLRKFAGPAAIEVLPAIEPGLDGETFMRELQTRLETRSAHLAREHRNRQPSYYPV